MKHHCYKAFSLAFALFCAPLLFSAAASASDRASESRHLKQKLSLLGFNQSWTPTDSGEKQVIDSGEIVLANERYFAKLSLDWMNETTLQATLMNSIALCSKLGIAVTDQRSAFTFEAFGSLTKKALSQPDARATSSISPYEYHVVIFIDSETHTSLECGVKRL
ncbi:hypothetical protein [Enterovibrio nigricans]|uniref:Uncharacterized protein n=1 Tax=Enterovibrio nigricans DSM 22720 TaxID=1121868 RepID=A0A1T4UTG8_9GAMM|nr:hypothetical protein [Enterovibrio nigricans]PKF50795.1 hypothetical protein AT251_08760 [Enterovibrio nigricans]SKA55731.1 hypothetical protein SAMN02745132_02416 [Enterovibrio nigricans DSM 22720]